ncbi:MAG: hypothetical protein PWP15_1545 [Methanothermococcus sp.]|jgi:hypothetical protein|uniref:hypothetical protein n=1 Tax=Methanothermococcus TaxID=155862 RepID=UPI000368B01E|nr:MULTISPECIES: hypothetical protein [Methanothermococcus]MDK2791036.1 hypothetical protein [Methanothermococcus sp.]MDK2988412.1 hypothetical protein [Methanothermococcus sp.]
MIDYNVILVIVLISLLLNVILFFKVVQLKKEMDGIKDSTRLTKEEVSKLNERLKRLKMNGGF